MAFKGTYHPPMDVGLLRRRTPLRHNKQLVSEAMLTDGVHIVAVVT
jgi:hypothetical protein